MRPGYYVVRRPRGSTSNRLIIESVCFQLRPDIEEQDPGYAQRRAESWCDFIQSTHPRDSVFVIDVLKREDDGG